MVDEKVVMIVGYILLGHASKLSGYYSESSLIQEVSCNTSFVSLYFVLLHTTLAFPRPRRGSFHFQD